MIKTLTCDEDINVYMKDKINMTSLEQKIYNIIYCCIDEIDTNWINLDDMYNYIKSTVPSNISTYELNNYIADYCATRISYHPDYNKMASMVCINQLHSTTKTDIVDVAEILYTHVDKTNTCQPLISEHLYHTIQKHHKIINEKLDMKRDYLFDYFGIKTLERSYLLKTYDKHNKRVIVERPQHMFMRVALGLHGNSMKCAFETYDLLSQKYMSHATPTLFNSGTPRPQLSSCFLLKIDDDLDNIFSQIKQIAMISKWAGGIGVHMSSVRGKGSLIRGTNGLSEGIVPFCGVLNKVSKCVNQGGKRKGSISVYMEPWHSDIFEFCELRKQSSGTEENRARDLFLALWTPNLFMKRVKNDEMWSLMCPNECKNLNTTYGEEFEQLYLSYESNKKFKTQIKARELWKHILECQIETGFPYMLYKDNVNEKSNQKNLGTICSSNLCCEICEYSDNQNTAVCNLVSLCLPRYVIEQNNGSVKFDYEKLMEVTRVAVRNLNKIIDINFYPSPEAKKSNKNNRPIGIGVQGLCDVYNIFKYDYESEDAFILNKKIFEYIYYAAIDESKELAKVHGTYKTFPGSPFSEGKLQFHLWNMTEDQLLTKDELDWKKLSHDVKSFGTRNSLLTALMPTAGTAQIMKCCESFEPRQSNEFVRTTMAGEFIVMAELLVRELIKRGIWSEDVRKKIIIHNGSIQNISEIPIDLKKIYKTAFEIKLKSIIKQSADRGPFIDQSQSMNLFMDDPDYVKLTSAHFYGWENGLKTGMYYLRGAAAVDPIQFGIDMKEMLRLTNSSTMQELMEKQSRNFNEKSYVTVPVKICKYVPGKNTEGCLMCSS